MSAIFLCLIALGLGVLYIAAIGAYLIREETKTETVYGTIKLDTPKKKGGRKHESRRME